MNSIWQILLKKLLLKAIFCTNWFLSIYHYIMYVFMDMVFFQDEIIDIEKEIDFCENKESYHTWNIPFILKLLYIWCWIVVLLR